MMKFIALSVSTVIIVSIFAVGCDSDAKNDALIGSAVGAGAGAIIGHQSGHATQGALIGGGAGAAGGYIIGNEQDKKQQGSNFQNPSPQQATNTVIVNIINSNGSVTPVKLTRSGNNYIGPRGEVYDHLPTDAELKPVYGF
jgi:uncharacterized protein YcfJ